MSLEQEWGETIRQQYLSGAANQFVLHGNVRDRLVLPAQGGEEERTGHFSDYLYQVQLKRFDLIWSYELGAGLRIEKGEELFRQLGYRSDFPAEPALAVAFLDQFLRFCVNLRQLSAETEGQAGNLVGRNFHIAIVFPSADLAFPLAQQTRDYPLNSMAAVVRSWSQEGHFLSQNLAVFVLTENLHNLNRILSQNPRAALVEIPLPGAAELVPVFRHFSKVFPEVLGEFANRPEWPAERLAGAAVGSLESLLKVRKFRREALQERDLAEWKKYLVEKDSQGLIEFVEPSRTLQDVLGHEPTKEWIRQDMALWRQGDLSVMPMGYLICGPVGTGKTFLVECLAGEAGVPVVKMKNFRDRWVGSTESNLEKIFALLHALGRCIVFVDEADQALGSRNAGAGDSGVSGRVYSMMAKEMSQTANRGKLLWVLATSRPDLVEVDLKRPGRVDVKIPLFPSATPEEAYALIRGLSKKHRMELPESCPEDLVGLMPEWVTPGAAEVIAIKVYRQVKTRGLEPLQALREGLQDYQNPVSVETMRFQIGLAVAEASDLDFVPTSFRDFG